jgi:hypothetical protein
MWRILPSGRCGAAAPHRPGSLKLPPRAADVTLVSDAAAAGASGFGSVLEEA